VAQMLRITDRSQHLAGVQQPLGTQRPMTEGVLVARRFRLLAPLAVLLALAALTLAPGIIGD